MIAALARLPTVQQPASAQPPALADPPELAALLRGVSAGEQRALERFYRLTISKVFGLALYIVRCRATAEEVAEDVYVQIWRSAATYDPQRCAPMGWALTICRSRAIDALRRTDRAITDADPTQRLDAVLQSAPGAQDLLQTAQQHQALHAALGRLGAEQRQILGMAFLRGLTHQEIAAAACMPLGTIKSHIRRALALLRRELGPV